MSLRSAIYIGRVRHRRRTPRQAFTFPLFMVYLDLAELDAVFSLTRTWGRSALSLARFRRQDYLGPHDVPLDEAVRRRVQQHLGRRPEGAVRMLTHLRYFGYIFNPVTFYYCFDAAEKLTAIIAEITNTPWKERHAYVLDAAALRADPNRPLRWRFGKEFHVSPFLPLNLEYDWSFVPPDARLLVHMNVRDLRSSTPRMFDATLTMERRPITATLLRSLLVRYPLMTAQVIARIHTEALKLWWRGAPVFSHPSTPPLASDSAPVSVPGVRP